MKKFARFARVVVCAACACVAVTARAAWVSEQDARKAAEAFVKNDAVGRAILSGCDVAAISQRGNIWVVSLAPSGQVLLGRSDLADPIVGFSKNDFSEPDPDSPAYAYLAGVDASLATLESNGGTRHDRWNRLLAGGTGLRLKAPDIENPNTVVIQPFLKSHYNQWQPYNDYAPVYEANTNNLDSYRGRCPCGCVATATAQGFRHFRWPARIDRVDSFNHDFTDANNVTMSFPLRFDGHLPMDWAALEDDYVGSTSVCVTNYYPGGYSWWWESSYDLRGAVPETTRHPIARLIMFADVLAHMSFEADGSGANYGTVASNASDWYKPGTWVSATDSRVQADIANGVPVQVTIPGHAVVGHGWANDGSNTYIYLNYGWGGGNDGYYNVGGSPIQIQQVYVGHYPRAKPQIDPLPNVCGTDLTLNWHFPDFYTNNLSGFTVTASRTATETSTFLDNFSASSGTPSSDLFAVGEDSLGYDGKLLYALSSLGSSYFTFPEKYTLTSASVLTFRLCSQYALGNSFEVQARFNNGDWTTILAPDLNDAEDSGWATERVYLGGHGGETVQLRLFKTFPGGSYYPNTKCILVDDFTVTDVLAPIAPEARTVGKTVRSLTLNGLAAGATYSFTVTPSISGALVNGESSAPVSTSIAGARNTPIPGEQTYVSSTLTFSTSDTCGTWSYSGTATSSTSVEDWWDASITATLQGALSSDSSLSFSWKANNNYSYVNGDFAVVFIGQNGNSTTLWSVANNSPVTVAQNVSLPLGTLAGQIGKIKISFAFESSNGYSYGKGEILSPRITNVLVPSVPAVAWNTETLTALGTPQILSVSSASEGFYRECGLGATTFDVTCSESVTGLTARPSHLSLVRDEDVTVMPKGGGRFSVTVSPSGVTADNARSRMILTLAATDSNGTTAYKDLSLRFAPMDAVVNVVTVNATTSSGSAFSVEVPYAWIETNGLVPSGSAATAYETALSSTADADGDGIPNWAEYVCGTSPTNSASKLTATIRIENGTPIVGYEPSGQLVTGFKAVVKGTNNLSEDFSHWQVTTGTTSLHFFRVEIIPE